MKTLLTFVCFSFMAAQAHAVLTGITSVTQSGGSSPVANDAILSGFVASGTSYGSLTAASASGEDPGAEVFVGDDSVLYPNPPGTSFPTGNEAYTDMNLTTGVYNTTSGNSVKFQFSGLTPSSIVYIFDFVGTDAPTLKLIDGTGSVISGDYWLSIADGDWGQPLQVDVRSSSSDFPTYTINGVIFSIDEFKSNEGAGTPYSGTDATGFLIGSSGSLDVIDVGLASAIPEPGTLALLLPGIGLLALRRRWNRGR